MNSYFELILNNESYLLYFFVCKIYLDNMTYVS
nr:MAG TPA: hypothetical protein [Bacteriophage sp.]